MMLALVQITATTTTARTTTKQAVNAAHIILRCHGVGYSFISGDVSANFECRPGAAVIYT